MWIIVKMLGKDVRSKTHKRLKERFYNKTKQEKNRLIKKHSLIFFSERWQSTLFQIFLLLLFFFLKMLNKIIIGCIFIIVYHNVCVCVCVCETVVRGRGVPLPHQADGQRPQRGGRKTPLASGLRVKVTSMISSPHCSDQILVTDPFRVSRDMT